MEVCRTWRQAKRRRSPIRRPAHARTVTTTSRSTRTSSCCSARPATWPGASCCPAWPTWTSPRWHPTSEIVGTSLEDLTDDEFRELAKAAIDEFGTHKLTDEQWARFAETVTYVPQSAGPEALAAAVAEAEAEARTGRPAAALPVGAAEGRPRRDHDAARRRPGRPLPGGDGEAVRHRPGQRDRAQRLRARDVRRVRRSSASTTSSARRPRRTSWRSASPTACSSRSGTATSSTTSRSTSPRRSAWTSGPTSTRAPAPTRTWWSPTCSR